jgi:hypothetical protein
MVAAMTIRATITPRPGYGAISCLNISPSDASRPEDSEGAAITVSMFNLLRHGVMRIAHDDDGGFAHPEFVIARIINANANGEPGGEMDPVERALKIW